MILATDVFPTPLFHHQPHCRYFTVGIEGWKENLLGPRDECMITFLYPQIQALDQLFPSSFSP